MERNSLACDARKKISRFFFESGSFLIFPLCYFHELFIRILLPLFPGEYDQCQRVSSEYAKRCFFTLALLPLFGIAIISTPLSFALRFIAIFAQKDSFTYLKGNYQEKTKTKKRISLFSWNICSMEGGLSLLNGGVRPWKKRIHSIIKKIKEKKVDVVCLQEVMNHSAAKALYRHLQPDFAHFYINIGPKTIGINSGLFVASKYQIKDPLFLPFSSSTLMKESKYLNKGFFQFKLMSENQPIAHIFTTHTQHSSSDESPTKEEKKARKLQIKALLSTIPKKTKTAVIITGDLNMDKPEYLKSLLHPRFYNHLCKPSSKKKNTCLADFLNHRLQGKKISIFPIQIDHTLSTKKISTKIIPGFDSKHPSRSLSDHHALLSIF